MVKVSKTALRHTTLSVAVAATTACLLLALTSVTAGNFAPTILFNGTAIAAATAWLAWLTLSGRDSLARKLDRLRLTQQLEESPSAPVVQLHVAVPPTELPSRWYHRVKPAPIVLLTGLLVLVVLGMLAPHPIMPDAHSVTGPLATVTSTITSTVTVTLPATTSGHPLPSRPAPAPATISTSNTARRRPRTTVAPPPTTPTEAATPEPSTTTTTATGGTSAHTTPPAPAPPTSPTQPHRPRPTLTHE